MAERKVISISVDPSTYFRIEVLAKRLSKDLYDDVSKSMVVRMAVRKLYEDLLSSKEVDHEKNSM